MRSSDPAPASGLSLLLGAKGAQLVIDGRTCPLLLRGANIAVTTVEEIDQVLMSPSLTRQDVRLLFQGEPVSPIEYESSTGNIDPRAIWDLFSRGRSIAFQRLDRHIPRLARLADEVSREVEGPAWVNAYVSPPGQGAFTAHRDAHNVIVVQVSGQKTWRFESLSETTSNEEEPAGPETDVNEGDVLFVPVGLQHEARSGNDVSVHLTIGFRRSTWREALIKAIDSMGAEFQQPSLLTDEHGYSEKVDSILQKLRDSLKRGSPAQRDHSGLLKEISSVRITAENVLIGTNHRGFSIRREGNAIILEDGSRRVSVPSFLDPIVSRLLHGTEVPISELAQIMDESGWRKLATTLLREGLAKLK